MNDANDIVVVDDNQVLVSVLSQIFKELGIRFEQPQTGSRRWQRYANAFPAFSSRT